MWYTISKVGTRVTLLPNYSGNAFTAVVTAKDEDGNVFVFYQTSVIAPDQISFDLTEGIDATYTVTLTNGSTGQIVEFEITEYDNFLQVILEDFNIFMCRDSAGTCNPCGNYSNHELSALLLRILSFYIINKNTYEPFFNAIIKCSELSLKDINKHIVYNDLVIGNKDNTQLMDEILAVFYFSFYYSELRKRTLEETNTLFNFQKITSCIKGKGIPVECIENSVNAMAQFTINSAAYINQPPSAVGDNTLNVGNRSTTVMTLAMFTTQTTPAYADPENDPVIEVRIDSLTLDGVLALNGTPVTAGQIISVTDINNSLLTYTSALQDALDTDTFTFSLKDAGSGQFAS